MQTIKIGRKWNNPEITVRIDHLEVEIGMRFADFMVALSDEIAQRLAAQIVGDGSSEFSAQIIAAMESASARDIFTQGADRVFASMKLETLAVA